MQTASRPTNDQVVKPLVSLRYLEAILGIERKELSGIATNVAHFYAPQDVRLRGTNKKWRHLDRVFGRLHEIQSRIQSNILSKYPFPAKMFGSVRGRSIRDNAAIHVRKRFVVTTDLKDCFPNTTNRAIFNVWKSRFGCSEEIANLLTKLTTFHRRLPQGAPSSPLLANLSLIPLYNDVEILAQQNNLEFSFFVDDIAISGDQAHASLSGLVDLIAKHGHAVSRRKIHVMDREMEQKLPGVVVNEKVSNGYERISRIRGEMQSLFARPIVTENEIRRLNGLVYQAAYVCPQEGEELSQFAKTLLENVVIDVDSQDQTLDKFERRRCRSFAGHRKRK